MHNVFSHGHLVIRVLGIFLLYAFLFLCLHKVACSIFNLELFTDTMYYIDCKILLLLCTIILLILMLSFNVYFA